MPRTALEEKFIAPGVQAPSVLPAGSASADVAPAEFKVPAAALIQPSAFLDQLAQAVQHFLRVVQSDVTQRPVASKPATVLLSYVSNKPDPAASVANSSSLHAGSTEQAVQTLADYLGQAGVPIVLIPLTTLDAFNQQLAVHPDANLVIICTPAYAAVVKDNPLLRQAIDEVGNQSGRADRLHTLLYEGSWDTAGIVVDKRYLIRKCQTFMQSKDTLTILEAVIDVLLHPSGSLGLGLLADLLDLEKKELSPERALYEKAFNHLQAQQQRLTIAYRLQQGFRDTHQNHLFQAHFQQAQSDIPVQVQQAVACVLTDSTIKTSLLLCQTSADTVLTGLALEKTLIDHGAMVVSIDCVDYSGKAAGYIVTHALHTLKLHRRDDRLQLSQGVLAQPIVILLKGYEHLGCYDNVYVKNELRRWQQVNVLVTCRADYFQHRGYENCFLSDPTNPNASELKSYSIPAFASKEAQAFAISPALQAVEEARRAAAQQVMMVQEVVPSLKRQAQEKEFTVFLAEQNRLLVAKGLLKETLADNAAVFISYAWEKGDALVRQQTHLRRIAYDLTTLGLPTWLDIERMTGNIDEQMAGNIERSTYALVIDTPLYRERMAIPTNVQKEYQAIVAKKAEEKLGVFALQFKENAPLLFDTLDFRAVDDGAIYIQQLHQLIPQLLHLQGQHLADYQKAAQTLNQRLALLPGKHLLVDKGQDDVQTFDIDSRLKNYIPTYGLVRAEDPFEMRFDLQKDFNLFLAQPTKTYVILGLAGSGKSLFTLLVFKSHLRSWHEWKAGHGPQPDFLPIYIPLRNYTNEKAEDCILSALRDAGLDETDIEHLRTGMGCEQKLLFILDGFDELGAGVLPNYPQKLIHWPTAKLLISGRPQLFEENGRAVFASDPQEQKISQAQQTFTLNHVSPFSPKEIETYVRRYDPATGKQTYETLKNLPGLMPLLDNPFLLNLTLQAFKRLLELQGGNPGKMKRSDIYQAFIETIFNKESAKQADQDRDHQADYQSFAQDLAFALFQAKQMSVTPSLSDIWEKFFANPAQVSLRAACPLKRSGEEYTFIHKSVYEYFVAVHLWEALGQSPERRNATWNTRLVTEERAVIDFLEEFYARNRPWGTTYLGDLEEMKGEEKQQENKNSADASSSALWEVVLSSQHNAAHAVAAASAATVLSAARVPFTDRDLSHTHLIGADLNKSVCDSTNFSYANLNGVNFEGAWLSHANFTQANLEGIELGELPSLDLKSSSAQSCAYSPDGLWLAVAAGEEIFIFDAVTRRKAIILTGHTQDITSIVYSPSGEQLASGSEDGTVRLCSMWTGQCEKILMHGGAVTSVVYSPNGEQLASGGENYVVRLWSVRTGRSEKTLVGHTHSVTSVAYSPSGEQLASGGGLDDNTVRLWSVKTGQCEKTLQGHSRSVTSVAYSPSGEQLASGSEDYTLRLWSVRTGRCEKILRGHGGAVTSVVYSPSGEQLVSGSEDRMLRLWSVRTGQCEKTLEGHTETVKRVVYSPNGAQLASAGSKDNTLRLWLVRTGQCEKTLENHTNEVCSVAYNPSGEQLVSGSYDSTLRLWSVRTGQCEKTLRGHSAAVNSVVYSPSGEQLASGSYDNTLRLWSVRTGQCEKILEGATKDVNSVAYSPSGEQLASGGGLKHYWSKDDTLQLWSVRTGQCEKTLEGHTNGVTTVVYSPSGAQLASVGHGDNTLRLWSVKTGQCEKTLEGHTRSITTVVYSPSGEQLASGSHDNTLRLWSVRTGQCEKTLEDHTRSITTVAYSPSGAQLASGSLDNTLRVWSLQPSSLGLELCQSVSAQAQSLAWQDKGEMLFLASGHVDTSVRYWQYTLVDNQPRLQLLWTSKQNALVTFQTKLDNVRGLSAAHFEVFQQRGVNKYHVAFTSLPLESKEVAEQKNEAALPLQAAASGVLADPEAGSELSSDIGTQERLYVAEQPESPHSENKQLAAAPLPVASKETAVVSISAVSATLFNPRLSVHLATENANMVVKPPVQELPKKLRMDFYNYLMREKKLSEEEKPFSPSIAAKWVLYGEDFLSSQNVSVAAQQEKIASSRGPGKQY